MHAKPRSVVIEGCVETRTYLDAGFDATAGTLNVTCMQVKSGCVESVPNGFTVVYGSMQEGTLTFAPQLRSPT